MDAVSNSRLNTFHNAHFDYTSIPTENSAIFVQCVKFHFRPNICSVNRYRFRFRYMRRVGYSEAVSLDRHSQSPVIFSPSVADPAGGASGRPSVRVCTSFPADLLGFLCSTSNASSTSSRLPSTEVTESAETKTFTTRLSSDLLT